MQNNQQDRCDFSVRYAGPATNDHLIDAGELARSIAGFNEALLVISKHTLPKEIDCSLKVNTTLRPGSVIADFVFLVSSMPPPADLFIGGAAFITEAKPVVDLLSSVIDLLKKFKGEKIPPAAVQKELDGSATVVMNNCSVNVNINAVNLYEVNAVRDSISQAFSPVGDKGVDHMSMVSKDGSLKTEVGVDDVQSFEPLEEAPSSVQTFEYKNIQVRIKNLSLNGGKRWVVVWGSTTLNARILDKVFLKKVEEGVYRFGNGDKLSVTLTQTIEKNKTHWEITKVHQVHSAPKQGVLIDT